jgi:hypothetical protein
MRKYLLKMFSIAIIGLLYSGCYTALWVPDGDYDSEDVLSNQEENYYQINYYGDYYYYYNRPWWYSAALTTQDNQDRNIDVNSLGDTDSGNGEFMRSSRTLTELPIASLPAISTSAPITSVSISSNFSKDKSADRVKSVNSSNNSSRNNNNSNNINHVRNNNGNRNTSGR